MHNRDKLRLAWQQMCAGGLRSGLCMGAVGIGVCAMVLIGGIGQFSGKVAQQTLDSLGLQGMTTYLQDGDRQFAPAFADAMVTQVDSVTQAMPVRFVGGAYQVGHVSGAAMLVGVDGRVGDLLDLQVRAGRLFWGEDTLAMGQMALISQSLAEQAFGRIDVCGKPLQLTQSGQTACYTILGVIADQKAVFSTMMGTTVPEIIYLPYAQLSGDPAADQIVFATQGNTANLTQQLARLATQEQYTGQVQVQNISGYMATLGGLVEQITTVFLFVAGISLVVALGAVASGLLSATQEMRPQIGICRAIGARKRDIFSIFLLQAQMLCLFGAAGGVLLAAILLGAIRLWFDVVLPLDWRTVGLCVMLSHGCGMVAGVYPAQLAAKLDPKEAMGK